MDYLHFEPASVTCVQGLVFLGIDEGFGLVGRHATIFSRVPRTTMQVVRIEANFYFDFGAM